MNTNNNTSRREVLNSEPTVSREALGSQYALQVALQTMKERCESFEQRLAASEAENRRLGGLLAKNEIAAGQIKRMVRGKIKIVNAPDESATEKLKEQIAELLQEKTQLLTHTCMVTAENHQLWEKLSRVSQVNQSLGSHLTKISDTLSRHDSSGSLRLTGFENKTHKKVLQIQDSNLNTMSDDKEPSLDEISLKVINGFKQEKSDLEDQCLQMADIQNSAIYPIQDLGINYMLLLEGKFTPEEIDHQLCQLHNVKELLIHQRTTLKVLLEKHKKNVQQRGDPACRECAERARVERESSERVTDNTAQSKGSQDGHVCPLCGKFYPRIIPFEDFEQHVMEHFPESDLTLD